MKNKKTLFLFTDSFPLGYNETYILSELNVIAHNFEKIFFFPRTFENGGANRFDFPTTSVVNIHSMYKEKKVNYFSILKIFLYEFFTGKNKGKYLAIEPLKKLYNAVYYSNRVLKFIEEEKLSPNEIVFYSYWNYHWALVISIIKDKYPESVAVSRAHLHDLYDYLSFNHFANYKYKKLDKLYCISAHGQRYLKENYQAMVNKFELAYLGSSKEAMVKGPVTGSETKYVLASCSSARKEKRVDRIIEILKQTKLNIEWHHFGGGILFNKLVEQAKSLPSNVNAVLHNSVSNKFILDFYEKNHIDLFLNVSLEEGLPFSLMEVISYGVPILACDVYGNKEICTETTGLLIEKDFKNEEVGMKIEDFLKRKELDRDRIVEFWNEKFNARKNFEAIAENLAKL